MLIYLIISVSVLFISPMVFLPCYLLSQFFLFYYSKINTRQLIIMNFLIALIWYFSFHYYLSLLGLNEEFQQLGIESLIVTDPKVLLALLKTCVETESIFRSLFSETSILLYWFGEKSNIAIVICNIF